MPPASNRLMGAGMFVSSPLMASPIVLSKCCSREAAASYGLVTPGTVSVGPKAQRSAFLVTASRVLKVQRSVSQVSSPVPKAQRLASLGTASRLREGERSGWRRRGYVGCFV